MQKILITGGAGFIGSNLSLTLLQQGFYVRVLDNLSEQIHGKDPVETSPLYRSINGLVDFVLGDVRDRKIVETALADIDTVVHLAAETGTGQSMYDIQHYCDVNTNGTALLLDILMNCTTKVKKIVVASSRAIYGEGKYFCNEHGVVYPKSRKEEELNKGDFCCKCPICYQDVEMMPTSEECLLNPSSVYGVTKLNQEQLVLTVTQALGISGIALRYQNVYGPGQSLSNPYTGILSIFSNLIREGKPVNVFEDGLESRDFVYISDVVDATILAIKKIEKVNVALNVGTGVQTSVLDVLNGLYSGYNAPSNYKISGNYRLGDIRHNVADLDLVKETINFSPKMNFAQGLEKFINWVLTQNIQADNYSKSLNELRNKGLLK